MNKTVCVIKTNTLLKYSIAKEKGETKAMEKTEKTAPAMKISGTLVSVDAMSSMIVVKTKKMEDTLTVDAAAKIMSGKKIIALGDLKTDAMVTVTWKMMDGKKTAMSIMEKPVVKSMKSK